MSDRRSSYGKNPIKSPGGLILTSDIPERVVYQTGGLFTKSDDKNIHVSVSVLLLNILQIQYSSSFQHFSFCL